MKAISKTIQVAVSILLALLILIQQRGTGLGAIGGETGGEFYATKRGAEKVIFRLTIILAMIFCINAFIFPLLPDSE
ncbi:MAG: preprotein translocase subunit SecG [Candidatus Gracilibacteria bacterium]|jgi:protein translocase SecG subunit|nr:preprotein translocase subunit SecG [Candidatus Gracilibacteria bacterium]